MTLSQVWQFKILLNNDKVHLTDDNQRIFENKAWPNGIITKFIQWMKIKEYLKINRDPNGIITKFIQRMKTKGYFLTKHDPNGSRLKNIPIWIFPWSFFTLYSRCALCFVFLSRWVSSSFVFLSRWVSISCRVWIPSFLSRHVVLVWSGLCRLQGAFLCD